MHHTSPAILILGGGVAGMSAALALKDQDVAVHLVEKSDHLGGNAGTWACMATTTCQNCGACLVREMADQVSTQANVRIHLNTRVAALAKDNGRTAATLTSGETLNPEKIIMATGFTPFNPDTLLSYHTRDYDRVITTARLNTLIREEALTGLLGKAPRIAFIQCVGSRDRRENRDYCSQVCCKISMRHAKKLMHLLPQANISLFYMDLQVMGKEARLAASELAGQIELIQGIPAEILENRETNALTMVVEDPATLSRKAREFDLVVLSVGMTQNPELRETAGMLGIAPNSWGFFNTDEAGLTQEVIVAGCAQGPKDIPASRQDGLIAAARAVEALDAGNCPGVAVLGDGAPALTAAVAAKDLGYPAFALGRHRNLPKGIRDFSGARILAVDGYNGRFSIFLEKDGKKQTLDCGAIIAAPLPDTKSNTKALARAVSLETFIASETEALPDRIAILLDYFGPENKTFSRQALQTALAARAAGKSVYILMNKMLVHGPEGQKAYDSARKAGVRFLRYDAPGDLDIQALDSGIRIMVREATLGGRQIGLDADTLVIPGTVHPSPGFADLARLLRLDLDREGFLQSANVRHRLVQSPRKGIFFAGPCHDETDPADLAREIRAIMAELELTRRARPEKVMLPVVINEKKCAKCLTCFRVCPHGAIILNEKSRPQIMPEACFACQSCVSNCPAYAIESEGFHHDAIAAKAARGRTLVLACERSGALAAAQNLPEAMDLVTLPCACRVSADLLMKALINGADRVIVSGCHQGNCRSNDGHAIAAQQVARVAALPGMPQGKVAFQTVAANESQTFARLISKA